MYYDLLYTTQSSHMVLNPTALKQENRIHLASFLLSLINAVLEKLSD